MTELTIRYWAAARAAAGCDSETRTGATVGEALDAAVAEHPGLGRIVPVSSLLVDGHRVDRSTTAAEVAALGDSASPAAVEVLPPFAGG